MAVDETESIVAGIGAGNVFVAGIDSANPPHARIGRVNRIKKRFIYRRLLFGGFRIHDIVIGIALQVAFQLLHMFFHN